MCQCRAVVSSTPELVPVWCQGFDKSVYTTRVEMKANPAVRYRIRSFNTSSRQSKASHAHADVTGLAWLAPTNTPAAPNRAIPQSPLNQARRHCKWSQMMPVSVACAHVVACTPRIICVGRTTVPASCETQSSQLSHRLLFVAIRVHNVPSARLMGILAAVLPLPHPGQRLQTGCTTPKVAIPP
jgi:hypothetical protein